MEKSNTETVNPKTMLSRPSCLVHRQTKPMISLAKVYYHGANQWYFLIIISNSQMSKTTLFSFGGMKIMIMLQKDILFDSVKKPIRIKHELLTRTRKIWQVEPLSVRLCKTCHGFLEMLESELSLWVHLWVHIGLLTDS